MFKFFLYDNIENNFIQIKDGFTCGRLQGDHVFTDDLVSRKQCQFSIIGNDIYVEDLNSTNQTKVNSVPLRPGKKRRIQLNDVIEFGTQRLILTNQNKFIPSNIQDRSESPSLYRGVVLSDGSVSSQIDDSITKKTLILLDRFTFHRLRLQESIFPPRPKFVKAGARPISKPKGQKTATSLLFAFNLISIWSLIFWVAKSEGALAAGLPYPPEKILIRFGFVVGVSLILGFFSYHLLIRKIFSKLLLQLCMFIAWFALTLSLSAVAAKHTSLLAYTAENLITQHCIRHFSANECIRYGTTSWLGFAQVPHSVAELAQFKLEEFSRPKEELSPAPKPASIEIKKAPSKALSKKNRSTGKHKK